MEAEEFIDKLKDTCNKFERELYTNKQKVTCLNKKENYAGYPTVFDAVDSITSLYGHVSEFEKSFNLPDGWSVELECVRFKEDKNDLIHLHDVSLEDVKKSLPQSYIDCQVDHVTVRPLEHCIKIVLLE